MKLFAGIALSVSVLFSSEAIKKPVPFLTQGNIIKYTISGDGPKGREHSDATLTITLVNTSKGNSKVDGLLTYYNEAKQPKSVYRVRFACDSLNFYAHATNWFYEPAVNRDDRQMSYAGDSLTYPLNMKPGDSLGNAQAIRRIVSKSSKSQSTVTFTDRKVVAKDTIDTPFGKTEAYRITTTVKFTAEAESKHSGGRRNSDGFVITEWFNPGIGVIRTQYSGTDSGNAEVVMDSYGK